MKCYIKIEKEREDCQFSQAFNCILSVIKNENTMTYRLNCTPKELLMIYEELGKVICEEFK